MEDLKKPVMLKDFRHKIYKKLINFLFKEKSPYYVDQHPPIRFYKINEDCACTRCHPDNRMTFQKDRIIVIWKANNNSRYIPEIYKTWLMATPTKPKVGFHFYYYLMELIEDKKVTEITIENIKHLKPHWHKEFKDALKHIETKS